MNVKFAKAADESKKVSAERVLSERSRLKILFFYKICKSLCLPVILEIGCDPIQAYL